MADGTWYKFDFEAKDNTLQPVYWAAARSWNGDNAFSTTQGSVYLSGTYLTDE